jgi:hypothetical protein
MRRGRRLTVFTSACAAGLIVAVCVVPASAAADSCTISVVPDGTTTPIATFYDVPVPDGTTTQQQLLDALVAAGDESAQTVDLGLVTLQDSCVPDTTTSTTSTTSSTPTTATTATTTTTTTTVATTPTTTTSATSTAVVPAAPTTTPIAPTPPTTVSPPASTTTSGSTTSTTTTHRAGTTTTRPTTTTSTTTTTTTGSSTTSTSTGGGIGAAHTRGSGLLSGLSAATPSSVIAQPTTSTSSSTTTTGTRKSRTKARNGSGKATPGGTPFSFSLPGQTVESIPNFFINSFSIPPFLLPIYQAAGIQYQVPWQVLAAINEIETDFGRNLSVSSAGAVGWMQFMPSTWKRWGVDANGDGVADPYNPVDAIFSAARYLHAAGASQNLSRAIFAYNHADWYVQSVLLRAKLIAGLPARLVGALTGMVEGRFPVAARATYADESATKVTKLSRSRAEGTNVADAVDSDSDAKGASIYARKGSPVIAVNDGKIVRLGHSAKLGTFISLQDSTGNTYTYAHLGSISHDFASPKAVKITHADIKRELAATAVRDPKTAASAGAQVRRDAASSASTPTRAASAADVNAATSETATTSSTATTASTTTTTASTTSTTSTAGSSVAAPLVKERLFAFPSRRKSYAAGGNAQIRTAATRIGSFTNYFRDTLHLAKNQYTLKRLRVGSIVVAGTILGRVGAPAAHHRAHMYFTIRPAGKKSPLIDPTTILDGWKLLTATDVYRAQGQSVFTGGAGAKNPTTGQLLLMSKQQLTERVLTDPHIKIYACGRRDIEAGTIDRRVLAVIEFLSASGLDPTVSGLACDASPNGSTGVDAAGATGESVDISAINGTAVLGHQGAGTITDAVIRRLLTLQGSMAPTEIVSDMSYKGASNTLALPDHRNRIQISYVPESVTTRKQAEKTASQSGLKASQWKRLINRLSSIQEPVVPISPSRYAIRDAGRSGG